MFLFRDPNFHSGDGYRQLASTRTTASKFASFVMARQSPPSSSSSSSTKALSSSRVLQVAAASFVFVILICSVATLASKNPHLDKSHIESAHALRLGLSSPLSSRATSRCGGGALISSVPGSSAPVRLLTSFSLSHTKAPRSIRMAATDVAPAPPRTRTRRARKRDRTEGGSFRYALLLHNDDVNKKDYVVNVLTTVVPNLDSTRALEIMESAHNDGKAVVRECDEEEVRKRLFTLPQLESLALGVVRFPRRPLLHHPRQETCAQS
mmetsp:Transcript_5019/g.12116  ORF Transcript_5019/g.12116 Transcript_5019/m.12116 type:complete len:266 (-) Transcript_5019:220-1017(-)